MGPSRLRMRRPSAGCGGPLLGAVERLLEPTRGEFGECVLAEVRAHNASYALLGAREA